MSSTSNNMNESVSNIIKVYLKINSSTICILLQKVLCKDQSGKFDYVCKRSSFPIPNLVNGFYSNQTCPYHIKQLKKHIFRFNTNNISHINSDNVNFPYRVEISTHDITFIDIENNFNICATVQHFYDKVSSDITYHLLSYVSKNDTYPNYTSDKELAVSIQCPRVNTLFSIENLVLGTFDYDVQGTMYGIKFNKKFTIQITSKYVKTFGNTISDATNALKLFISEQFVNLQTKPDIHINLLNKESYQGEIVRNYMCNCKHVDCEVVPTYKIIHPGCL